MGSPTIFSGNNTKSLKPNLDLAGNVTINSGALDPTSVAVSANLGSLYISTSTGLIYQKLDSGSSVNWVVLGQGANVTDWVAYTPTFSAGFGTVASVNARWRRVGDTLQVSGTFVTGTTTAALGTIALPNGLSINTSKFASYANFTQRVGTADRIYPGAAAALYNQASISTAFALALDSTSPTTVYVSWQLSSGSYNGNGVNTIIGSTEGVYFEFAVPIVGWHAATAITTPVLNFTDWAPYTPTLTGFGTVSGVECYWRRVSDSVEIQARWVNGTTTATTASISLPNNIQVDSSGNKIGADPTVVGKLTRGVADTGQVDLSVLASSASGNILNFGNRSSISNPMIASAGNVLAASGEGMTFFASVPIQGWTSSTTGARTAPKITTYTSGSGTHNLTGSPLYIRVRMVGGGGAGGAQSLAAGGNGTASTFGPMTANGGSGASYGGSGVGGSGAGGAGGSAILGAGPTGTAITGGSGSGSNASGTCSGGMGGSNPLGGGGGGGYFGTNDGYAGAANTGAGGGGGGATGGNGAGGGGGAGGFIDAIISSPVNYSYAVGTGGAHAAGSNAGGDGADGYIEVTEYYQ